MRDIIFKNSLFLQKDFKIRFLPFSLKAISFFTISILVFYSFGLFYKPIKILYDFIFLIYIVIGYTIIYRLYIKKRETAYLVALLIYGYFLGAISSFLLGGAFFFIGHFIIVLMIIFLYFSMNNRLSLNWASLILFIATSPLVFHIYKPMEHQTIFQITTRSYVLSFIYFFITLIYITKNLSNIFLDVIELKNHSLEIISKQKLELKGALVELKRSEEQYSTMFNLIPDIFFQTDIEGNIIFSNLALLREFGLVKEELKNMKVFDFFPMEDITPLLNVHNSIKAGEAVRNFEIQVNTKDDFKKNYEINVSPILDDNEVIGSINIARDLTDRKELEAVIIQQERRAAMGALTADFAHNFNNHLMNISAQVQLLEIDEDIPAGLKSKIPPILDSCDDASSLILKLTEIEPKRKRNAKLEKVNVIDQIKLFNELFAHEYNEQIKFKFNPDDKLFIKTDPLQFYQVIKALVDNSNEAIEKSGEIRVEVSEVKLKEEVNCLYCYRTITGRWIKISVIDNGKGIGVEKREVLFDPFFTTKDDYSGVGLGLTLSAGIVAKSHGHIYLDSKPQKGTCVDIYLPPAS